MQKSANITGDILRGMAAIFWTKLPQYTGQESPKFCTGWPDGFKHRHQIKRCYRRHEEAGFANQVAVENEIEDLGEELQAYKSEEIYNIGTLATEQTPGGKHDKARISTNLAVNTTGTDRVPPWFIGIAATPRCFGRSGVNARNRRMVWLSNQKA